MLYPQQNDKRNMLDLSGFWDFKLDPEGNGEEEGWYGGLTAPRTIAVPASWNELYQDTREYLDTAWYVRECYVPSGWRGQQVYLRIGSANLANRSMGLDTECDLALESEGRPEIVQVIRGFRAKLLAEHLGVPPERVAQTLEQSGSLIETVEKLRDVGERELAPLDVEIPEWLAKAHAVLCQEEPAA